MTACHEATRPIQQKLPASESEFAAFESKFAASENLLYLDTLENMSSKAVNDTTYVKPLLESLPHRAVGNEECSRENLA